MIIHSSQLREKDVINLCDGRRLGFICDFSIDTDYGKITAIHVSDHFFGLNGGKNTVCIPWERICCIGDDTILVRCEGLDHPHKKEYDHRENCEGRRKGSWLFG